MFKIVEKRRAWWPVKFGGVTEEGRVVENKIELRFLIPDEDELAALLVTVKELSAGLPAALSGELGGEAGSVAIDNAAAPSETYAAIVEMIADDWRGVGGENGEPLPFAPENVGRLMRVPNVFMATMAGFRACRAAAPEIRSGN